MDRRMKIQIVMPFLLIFFSMISAGFISFKPSLSPAELRIAEFVPKTVELRERQPSEVSGLKSLFEVVKQEPKGILSAPLSTIAPQPSKDKADIGKPVELKASMIVVTESRRLAIVNNQVVRENDIIERIKIERIEKDRIMITEHMENDKAQGKRWIYLEDVR